MEIHLFNRGERQVNLLHRRLRNDTFYLSRRGFTERLLFALDLDAIVAVKYEVVRHWPLGKLDERQLFWRQIIRPE